jgi:diaminopimelate epimerase
MKNIKFAKMSGNGNDFIVIDNRNGSVKLTGAGIRALCTNHFSIGADGLILAEKATSGYDFYMKFYNNDGKQAEMCGNGGRCISRFAHINGFAKKKMRFLAKDGAHDAEIMDNGNVKLRMIDPFDIKPLMKVKASGGVITGFFVNTGVPHFVTVVKNIDSVDVKKLGKELRFHRAFYPAGTNVNFVGKTAGGFAIRTYERGVEDETLACGTGATAAALALYAAGSAKSPVSLTAKGGKLRIYFNETAGKITDVYLEGNARVAAEGTICPEAYKF